MLRRRWEHGERRGRCISMEKGLVRGRDIGRSWFGMGQLLWGKCCLFFFFFFFLLACSHPLCLLFGEGPVLIHGGMCIGAELLTAMVLVVGMRRGGILFVNITRRGMWRGSMRRRWGR